MLRIGRSSGRWEREPSRGPLKGLLTRDYAFAYRGVAISTIAAKASINRTLILIRRGSPVDWCNILVMRFVLCGFLFAVRHSRLIGLRIIGYYRKARAGLQGHERILRRGERTAVARRRSRERSGSLALRPGDGRAPQPE